MYIDPYDQIGYFLLLCRNKQTPPSDVHITPEEYVWIRVNGTLLLPRPVQKISKDEVEIFIASTFVNPIDQQNLKNGYASVDTHGPYGDIRIHAHRRPIGTALTIRILSQVPPLLRTYLS